MTKKSLPTISPELLGKPPEKLYTSTALAEVLQVNVSAVVKWADTGLLFSYRTPGGHRRFRSCDVLTFLRSHRMFVPPELGGAKSRVLFVGHDGYLLGAVKRALNPSDRVDLLVAPTWFEALIRVGLDRPDFFLLDCTSPDVDVLQVVTKLKDRPETRPIQVVLLVPTPHRAVDLKARALGARVLRSKPSNSAAILRACNLAPIMARSDMS